MNETGLLLEAPMFIRDYGDASDILQITVGGRNEPLAQYLHDRYDDSEPFWSVRYFVSSQELHGDEWTRAFVETVYGKADTDYAVAWSEITGYLFTDEKINVGSHDLLGELHGLAKGGVKWLRLEIAMSANAKGDG